MPSDQLFTGPEMAFSDQLFAGPEILFSSDKESSDDELRRNEDTLMQALGKELVRKDMAFSAILETPQQILELKEAFRKFQKDAELQKLRQDFDKYISDQAARHAAEEQRHKSAEKRQFWQGVLAGTIGSTVAGLIVLAVQNWFVIIDIFSKVFH